MSSLKTKKPIINIIRAFSQPGALCRFLDHFGNFLFIAFAITAVFQFVMIIALGPEKFGYAAVHVPPGATMNYTEVKEATRGFTIVGEKELQLQQELYAARQWLVLACIIGWLGTSRMFREGLERNFPGAKKYFQ